MAIPGRPSELRAVPEQLERNFGGELELVIDDPDCVTSCRAAVQSPLLDSRGRSLRLAQGLGPERRQQCGALNSVGAEVPPPLRMCWFQFLG